MTGTPAEDGIDRWRPARAGILNVWRYYREVFTFHRGRLLLRGRNGTGKSKALELLLPFLLDASLRPNRLSTFGGNERAMHWNMIGHGYPGATRVGYVWLEFERPSGEGTEYLTLGARLQATRDVSSVKPTYFTSTSRVDEDLSLLTPEQQPLTVKQLKTAIQEPGHGTVYSGPEEYRSAVRALLYPRLDQARYDALITALLQLRTPKLSERLDPGLLSSLLSSALPPLGQGELADIAGGFERLDRHRERLRKLTKEVESAKDLAARQRVYASRVLRGAAAELTAATAEMGRCAERLRTGRARAHETEEELFRLGEREVELEELFDAVSSERQGLKDSEAYRAGSGIDLLREQAGRAAEESAGLARESERRRAAAEKGTDRAREAADVVARSEQSVSGARSRAEHAALRADLAGAFEETERVLAAGGRTGVTQARRLMRAAVSHREGLIREVHTAWNTHRERLRRRQELESDLGEAGEEFAEAKEGEARAESAHEARTAALAEALTTWARACVELPVGDPERLTAEIDPETGAGPHAGVTAARQRAGEELAMSRQRVRQRAEEWEKQRKEVTGRIFALNETTVVAPPTPHTRTADRAGRSGAPLWRLVGFADGVPEGVRAGVEGALEASGLLDAWVMPDGSVPEVVGDTALAAPAHSAAGPDLMEVLVVEEDAPVPAEHVRAVLAGVSYEADGATVAGLGHGGVHGTDAPVVVCADGRWRLGHLHGHAAKEAPTLIGALARERNRARLVAELTAKLAEIEAAQEAVEEEGRALDERRRRLDAEVSALPSDAHARRSARELRSAQELVALRRAETERRRERLADHESRVASAERELQAVTARHRLPADPDALESARSALGSLSEAVETWLDGRAELFVRTERLRQAQGDATAAKEEAVRAVRAATAAERNAKDLGARLAAVEATVGVEHRRVQERVALAERRLKVLREDLDAVRSEQRALQGRHGELVAEVRVLDERNTAAIAARDTAADRFRELLDTSLFEDSGLDVPVDEVSTVRGVLDTARAVSATSQRADHSPERLSGARARVVEAVHGARDVLAGRTYLELVTVGETQRVSALLDGVRMGARGLYEALAEEHRVRSADLTEEEHGLFDRVLTGDTRRHLAERIRRATGLVEGMNERLGRVRTASRISVRLRWEVAPDAPHGTERARALLVRDPRNLDDTEREVLHAFFRERIDDARAEDSAAGWEEHLTQVLDYTSWHRFTVELDRDDGRGWQRLTRREHGGLSGGEKAIALHLPLFAAVAAHYATDPGAPRFILLDEVFVGVDTANRGQIFALLVDLGLDLVLTSDHEWCTYAELDGIAVHQLIPAGPDETDDAVTTARWVWTGSALAEAEPAGEGGSAWEGSVDGAAEAPGTASLAGEER